MLALVKPWEASRRWGVGFWPQRNDIIQLRPATRVLLLVLGSWAAGALVLALAITLWPATTPVLQSSASQGLHHLRDYAAITERPLFARTRRSPAIPSYVPPVRPVRDRNIVLKGVFRNGSHMKAFLTSGSTPQGQWLNTTDTIAGWTITSVMPEEVHLTAEGDTLTVLLHPIGQGARVMRPPLRALPALANDWSRGLRAIEPGQPSGFSATLSATATNLFGMRTGPHAKMP